VARFFNREFCILRVFERFFGCLVVFPASVLYLPVNLAQKKALGVQGQSTLAIARDKNF